MRSFLLGNGPAVTASAALIEAMLAAVLWKKYREDGGIMTLCTSVLCTGLVYDAAVIALGKIIPAGILPGMSRLRYVCSGLMIPLLFPISAYSVKWKGAKLKAVWVLTAVLMAVGIAEGFAEHLEPVEFAGLLRYVSTDSTPKWAQLFSRITSVGTVIPLIAAGIVSLIKQKKPWILLSGTAMFAFSAIGPATHNMDLMVIFSMFGEALMILFLLFHIRTDPGV